MIFFSSWFVIGFGLVPPTLRAVPQNGQVSARKGSTVTLECKASGNPVPTIYWFKKVNTKTVVITAVDIFSGYDFFYLCFLFAKFYRIYSRERPICRTVPR